MKSAFAKAVIVCTLVSFLVVVGNGILFARSTTYSPGVSATDLARLDYLEAVALMESRAQQTTGFSAFLDSADSVWFWQHFLASWAVLASICLLCCLLLNRWVRS